LIGDGREIERRDDHAGTAGVVERLRHGRERDRDARRERDFRGASVHDARIAAAQLRERAPPDIVPGGRPASLPDIEKFGHAPARALAQGTEGARVQVDAALKDRELAPVAGERVSPGGCGGVTAGERHSRSIYRRRSTPGTPRE